jgi:hypothetical protein
VDDAVLLQSNSVKRFAREMTHRLAGNTITTKAILRDGHPLVSRHEFCGVEFHLFWKGEQSWTMRSDAGQWRLTSNMLDFYLYGDEKAFTRDMTMLMMAGDLLDESQS